MICGVVGHPSPTIVPCSLSFAGRKNISGRLREEAGLQKAVECKLTIERSTHRNEQKISSPGPPF